QYPNSLFDDVLAQPLADAVLGPQRKLVFTLFGAVFFVLLIACANVANLLMARAASRRAEVALRGALGASRSRLMRQLLIECLMLAIGGGVLGLVVAKEGIRFLTTSPASIPRLQDAILNGMVVLFTLTISVACAFFFGLLPAFGASRLDVQQTLRDGGREASVTSRDPARGALVVAELCLSDVLLIGAALLIRSHLELEAVSPGFNQHGVTLAGIVVPSSRYQ